MPGVLPASGAVLAWLMGHGARVPRPVSGISTAPHAFGLTETPARRRGLRWQMLEHVLRLCDFWYCKAILDREAALLYFEAILPRAQISEIGAA